jgi:hypothetical protein
MMLRVNAKLNSSEPAGNNSGQEKGRALDVVLACEDFTTGMHALCAFDELFPANDSKPAPGAQSVWKFELLGITSLREVAAAEAAGAQMVIISAHAPAELPATVKSWVENWTKDRRTKGGAVMLLLDDAGDDTSQRLPVEAYLENRATDAGMEFTVHKAAGRHALHGLNLAMAAQKIPETLNGLKGLLLVEQGTGKDPV